jgi:hypothetical protein
MKTKEKKQCKVNCGCDPVKKPKTNCSNGKGDKARPSDKSIYNKNYENINWSEK